MVGQSKVRLVLRALVPEPSNEMINMSDLTPSKCFRTIAVSLAIDPNKIPSLLSIIEYEGHHHPLFFIENSSSPLDECNAYDSYCKQLVVSYELSETKSTIFRCEKCDFNMHLLCGPLPPIIKYEFHIHRLTLVDSFLEDSSGDYYCDVSRVLKADYGDANLRIINERALSTSQNDTLEIMQEHKFDEPLPTLSEMIRNLKEEEQRLLAQHFEAGINYEGTSSSMSPNLQDSFYSDVFHNSEEEESEDVDSRDFRRITTRIKLFFKQKRLQLNAKNLDVQMVKIADYMVPWTLVPVLGMLFQCGLEEQVRPSPGNFQILTSEMKSLSFSFLCHLINSMSKIRVGDVREELLRDWYCHAMFLKRLGFRISFVFQRLRQVSLAYFGLQVSRFASETPTTLTREIENGKQEIIELEEKISKLKEKTAEQEAELKRYKSSPKSNFANKCLKEASILEWKIAGDDRFKI
ncbi:hypothetical protein TIFTF001_038520 [Ficus carica]|uniref:Uncharacterized protein n=1 Tax=Ficus carica TaxID=3494 RepID=A0AA88EBM8_FICCA|nr:hypothetical protein TIFTF001_038520 [Ficus carica]